MRPFTLFHSRPLWIIWFILVVAIYILIVLQSLYSIVDLIIINLFGISVIVDLIYAWRIERQKWKQK